MLEMFFLLFLGEQQDAVDNLITAMDLTYAQRSDHLDKMHLLFNIVIQPGFISRFGHAVSIPSFMFLN